MKKVLLIGGAGFIGYNIAKYLCEHRDYDITIADNFFRGKLDDPLTLLVNKHQVKIVEADFTKQDSFSKLGSDYDQVYMLASVVGVKYTEEIPNEIIRINGQLIINTLEWLKKMQGVKVVFASTSECYAGTIDRFHYTVPTPDDVPLTIDDIRHQRFTYAVTKMFGESGFLNYAKVFGFSTVIVRYHNVYGPRMGFEHVIPQVAKRFFDCETPFNIIGHEQTRSFNYIDDAVQGTVLAMESEESHGQIFHIGDMKGEITIRELCEYIGGLFNYSGSYIYEAPLSGSVSRRCPDIRKAEKMLGYSPKVDWRTGVKNTVEWYTQYYKSGGKIFE